MRPLRVLVVAPTSFFADYGCHVRIRGHLTGLRSRGHCVLLATYPSGRDVEGIPTIRAPWPGGSQIQVGSSRLKLALDALLGPTALVTALRFQPQIVHAYLHEGALIGAVISMLLRRPLIFDHQGSLTGEMLDHGFLQARSAWLRPLVALERWTNRRPDVVLVSSAHGASLLQHDGSETARAATVSRQRLMILPDSVDPNQFRPAEQFDPALLAGLRARLDLPQERHVIIYLGLLAPYQGTDLLLQAIGALAHAREDVHLLLMGFPFVDRYRARAAALGIANRVTFTGPVPYEMAPMYLALGEVGVAPKLSATEGSGKLLPYMATGLPIAAFDTPVHREYLGDLGIYARPGDADALAKALAYLLSDPGDAAARGRALRQRAVEGYTWDRALDIIETAYQSACHP